MIWEGVTTTSILNSNPSSTKTYTYNSQANPHCYSTSFMSTRTIYYLILFSRIK
uniref:Uncharacterized protein n=1 Tax=Lepeophtheirus salmonis TaxID=72036 RepID=A0A0K2T904_LEPSM